MQQHLVLPVLKIFWTVGLYHRIAAVVQFPHSRSINPFDCDGCLLRGSKMVIDRAKPELFLLAHAAATESRLLIQCTEIESIGRDPALAFRPDDARFGSH
jgi:hypothetical protein